MNGLSPRQEELLKFIKAYMLEYDMTPTIRDMCKGMNLKSTASVYTTFMRLVAKGYIVQPREGSYRYSVKGMKYVDTLQVL